MKHAKDTNASQPETPDTLTWQDLQNHALWWVRLVYNTACFFRDVLFKHWRTSLPLMLAGLLLSLALLRQRAGVYQMAATFVYGDLHPKIFGDMVAKLDALLNNGRADKAGGLMQLTEEQAKKIRKVEISDIKGKKLTTNYTFRKEPMIFTITLSAPISEDSLRQAITGYFNSNPFTADRLEMKKRQLREEMAFIEEKLQAVDSILAKLYAGGSLSASAQSTVTIENSEGKNAHELLSFSRELQQRKAEIERNLAIPENVIPIDNFILLPKARWDAGHVILYGISGIFAGFLLASAAAFWRDRLRKLVQG